MFETLKILLIQILEQSNCMFQIHQLRRQQRRGETAKRTPQNTPESRWWEVARLTFKWDKRYMHMQHAKSLSDFFVRDVYSFVFSYNIFSDKIRSLVETGEKGVNALPDNIAPD